MVVLSIAIPVYNAEPYLCPCLNSICAQVKADTELLLVDDGSSDRSGIICEEYAEKFGYIHVVHQSNQGVSAARNQLMQMAHGKWIVFVDSDDILSDDALMIMRGYADGTDELVVFQSRRFWGDFLPEPSFSCAEENCMTGRKIADFRTGILDETYQESALSAWNLRSPWAKMWNLDHLRNSGISFQRDLKFGEDMLFNFAATRNMKQIRLVPACLYGYRNNESSVTLRFSADAAVFCGRTMKSLRKEMKEHGELEFSGMRNAFYKKSVSFFGSALNMSVQHPGCPWSRAERLEQIQRLASMDWVQEAAEYAAKTNTLTVPLWLALERRYDRMERYCRRKCYRYSIVRHVSRNARGRKFVEWYAEIKKKLIRGGWRHGGTKKMEILHRIQGEKQ